MPHRPRRRAALISALARAIVGISAVLGAVCTRPWAQDVFLILKIVAAVSGLLFLAFGLGNGSLAMVPVTAS